MSKIRHFKIKLQTINDVHDFSKLAVKYNIEADVHVENNLRHVVPADSFLGLLSLDLTQKLIVDIIGGSDEELDCFLMGIVDEDNPYKLTIE